MKRIFNQVNVSQAVKSVYFLLILVVFTFVAAHAQVPDPGGDVDQVPIDGGLSLLVAAGVGYGAKKLKEKRGKTATGNSIG
jgi:hypothetical protein